MEKSYSKKKSRGILFLSLLLIGGIVSLLPFGTSSAWRTVFTFFGLTDFSSCADSYPVSVHVLDVGKADSILVECQNHFMLVDGGMPDCGREVCTYLKRRGAKKLDAVVNTHPDKDHIGGLKYVLKEFSVTHYFAPEIPKKLIPNNKAYLDVQEILKEKKITPIIPHAGDTFSLNGLTVQVLGPLKVGNNTNNNSILLRLTFGSVRFLLMGDAEKEEEEDLVQSGNDIRADILKVGHHGSDSSTTDDFLKAVSPRYAAISVGWDRNHLPNREVLAKLYHAGIQVYRTDVSGTLIFLTDGKSISVKTEK